MIRAMWSGVSGLKANQVKMDVISNNIANVNTTSFKGGRVTFQDLFSQTMQKSRDLSTDGRGGSNAMQVGLGTKVSAINTLMNDGILSPTSRDLDFGIDGGGFFALKKNGSEDEVSYTRDGAFYMDKNGNLVTASGMRVLGYQTSIDEYNNQDNWKENEQPPTLGQIGIGKNEPGEVENGMPILYNEKMKNPPLNAPPSEEGDAEPQPMVIPKTITITKEVDGVEVTKEVPLEGVQVDKTGLITASYDGQAYFLGRLAVVTFQNPEGLEKLGDNTYSWSNNSGEAFYGVADTEGYGATHQGYLEMSNVDLSTEFTDMIITSRSYQANSRSITTADEMLQELLSLKR